MNKDLITEIFVPTEGGEGRKGSIATGYPIARDRILTARHPLYPDAGPARDPSRPIEVRWRCPGVTGDWQPVRGIAWENARWDLALLDCALPPGIAANRGFVSETRPDERMRWKSVGFPRVGGRRDDRRTPFDMQGAVYSALSAAERFQVGESAGPSDEEAWKGASGAPVFVDWRILGVIVSVPADLAAKRLDAVPLWRVLREEPDFRKQIGFDNRERRHEQARRDLQVLLVDAPPAMEALARQRPALAKALGDGTDRAGKAARLADALLRLEVPDLIDVCERAHAGLGRDPAAVVISRIARVVLPAIYDHGVVETVRSARGQIVAELLTLPACYPTVAEIIMAGADRRAAEFCEREREDAFPRGRYSLPAPPECGFDSEGRELARALDEHLAGKFGWASPAAFDLAMDDFMVRRFPGPGAPGSGDDRARRIRVAAREIAYQAERRGRTYYLIVKAPPETDERLALATALAAVRERYRGLMCVTLPTDPDPDLEESEFASFRPLLELLPKRGPER